MSWLPSFSTESDPGPRTFASNPCWWCVEQGHPGRESGDPTEPSQVCTVCGGSGRTDA